MAKDQHLKLSGHKTTTKSHPKRNHKTFQLRSHFFLKVFAKLVGKRGCAYIYNELPALNGGQVYLWGKPSPLFYAETFSYIVR